MGSMISSSSMDWHGGRSFIVTMWASTRKIAMDCRLAPVTSLRYASVVGSHANQAARCIWHKIAHDDDRPTVDGKFSLEKLESVDKAWARSIRGGLAWLVNLHPRGKVLMEEHQCKAAPLWGREVASDGCRDRSPEPSTLNPLNPLKSQKP